VPLCIRKCKAAEERERESYLAKCEWGGMMMNGIWGRK